MSEELRQVVEFTAQETVRETVRAITESFAALDRQARKTGENLRKALGGELSKAFGKLTEESRSFGADMVEAAGKAAQAFKADTAAIAELRSGLRGATADEKALGNAMKAAQTAGTAAVRQRTAAVRTAASASARASQDDFRQWRAKWRRRQASERADAADLRRRLTAGRYLLAVRARSEKVAQREADRVARAEAAATARKAREDATTLDRRVKAIRYLSRVRERSEAAELRNVRTIARERDAMRRHASRSGQHAYHHGQHAIRSLNHPVHESIGFALTAGAAAGGAFAEHVVRASEAFDTSMSRLRMFAPQLDGDSIRSAALHDSIALGVDASTIVDSIAKSVRDGVPPAIAQSLPKSIIQTAQVMGGDIERLTDSLAEGIQESTAMGWIKDQHEK